LLENRLLFKLSEFEVDPSGVKTFVRLDVEAEAGHFSGASHCVLRGQDLVAFLDRLTLLAAALPNDAELVGGWGKDEHVRVQLSSVGRAGHFKIRVLLSDFRSDELGDRLEASFETEPASLLRFSEDLRRALDERREASANLYVLGGPAV
jgi:hypothetical protein